ncbi:MAG: glycosyltransferase [Chitinivibrionales bacterium]|nr:glycosyltransferase [Chitinivibrionales bacterium]MBD3394047.1 glycosyltransferase [Chitinivibrionales bacterium]
MPMKCPPFNDIRQAEDRGWPWTGETPSLADTMPGGTPWPAISIVTPSFNQGAFIEKTIRSVLLQGYPNLEYVIMDGGSTDGSVDIIKKYEPWLTSWVSEKDPGQAAAINKGFARTTGAILGWLNSDDIYLPGALAKVAETAAANPDASAFAGKGRHVDARGRILYDYAANDISFEGLVHGRAFVHQPSCFFTKEVFERVGGLDESLFIPMDLDLWLKISRAGRFAAIPARIAEDLAHPDAKCVSDKYDLLHTAERIVVLARYDESVAKEEILNMLRFIRKTTSLPFYKPLRGIYRRLFGATHEVPPGRP